MRRCGRSVGKTLGAIAIGAGLLVILSQVLPAGFWWLALGLGLIVVGVTAIRKL